MEEEKKEKIESNTNKKIWIFLGIGILIGIVLLYCLMLIPAFRNIIGIGNKTIAKSKAGKITEDELYNKMKNAYPISYLLELMDKSILEKKYELTDEQKKEITDNVDRIIDQYKTYGYSENEFFEQNGFKDRNDFMEYMELDYRRNLYYTDYFKAQIPEEKVEEYYKNNEIYGTINTKHILARPSDTLTDSDALALIKEILVKLNDGKSFEDVGNEYSDKILFEDVDFDSFTESSIASEYVEASKALNVGEYTKEAVKTDFGYHIIYCVSKDEKPTLEQARDKIINALEIDLEAEDLNIRYKALIQLREENNLKFIDKEIKSEYEEYCKKINE